jgi:hypothetical protein
VGSLQSVDDLEVIDAFVNRGARRGFGPSLHIEGDDVLMLDGWWHLALRVSPDAFIVRGEEPPRQTTIPDDITRALSERGFAHVASDLPGLTVLTMSKASLGYVEWQVWAADVASAHAAVAAAVTEDSFFQDTEYYNPTAEPDYSSELAGARRLAGLPPSIVLTVGLPSDQAGALENALDDCRFVNKAFGEIEPDACGSLIPTVIVIDASEQQGREFVMQLRAVACGRYTPVVAVTPDAVAPLGADTAVRIGDAPSAWAPALRSYLP